MKSFVKGRDARPGAAGADCRAGRQAQAWAWTCCRGRRWDFAKFGPIETKPLSRVQKISGANLARNWVMIPHVTFNDDCDITELEELPQDHRQGMEKSRPEISPLAFIIKGRRRSD